MMSQTTINSFFAVRKKPDDQHAAKRRKIAADGTVPAEPTPESTASVVTSAVDDHRFAELFNKNKPTDEKELLGTPADSRKTRSVNKRDHKAKLSAQFSVGKAPEKSAKKQLNVKFIKGGKLSPSKKCPTVAFEKKGFLSPKKLEKSGDQEKVEAAAKKLQKLTPEEIKAKIGTVNKLSDLKAQLRSLKKDRNVVNLEEKPKHRRNLFDEGPINIEVAVPETIKSPVKRSPVKASPRKQIPAHIRYADLTQPDKYLPLPQKYKFLTEVFRNVDQIVSMKFNRKEIIRVADIKPAVQNIMRKNFTNHYLRQIRCVFPKAYSYVWEKICDRLGRHTGDYELHMGPILSKGGDAMNPGVKVERVKLFQHALLTIAKDYHRDFLKDMGIEVEDEKLTKWHRDFEIESCPEIDTADLPAKPQVEKMGNAKDMIAKLSGVNSRLESVLKAVETKQEAVKQEEAAPEVKPVLRKGLQGLPQHLIDKILAKEKEKRIRDMTQNKEERKDLEVLKELVTLGPVIVNCHRNVRRGAAVPMDTLCKVTADSHGRKSLQEIVKLVEMFLKVVPECMEIKKYDKVEYVKLKKDSPDVNEIRSKLEALVRKNDVTK